MKWLLCCNKKCLLIARIVENEPRNKLSHGHHPNDEMAINWESWVSNAFSWFYGNYVTQNNIPIWQFYSKTLIFIIELNTTNNSERCTYNTLSEPKDNNSNKLKCDSSCYGGLIVSSALWGHTHTYTNTNSFYGWFVYR